MRKIFTLLLMLLPLFAMAQQEFTTKQPEGEGTEEKPYLVGTREELLWVTENKGSSMDGVHIQLTSDIDLNPGFTFNEDGTYTSENGGEPLQWIKDKNNGRIQTFANGEFDGNGHTIKGVYVNDYTALTRGFIGVNRKSIIKNLRLENGYIGVATTGFGICSMNENGSQILNCYCDLSIQALDKDAAEFFGGGMAGICCYNGGILKDCIFVGTVKGWGNDNAGICSYNGGVAPTALGGTPSKGEMSGCINLGKVIGEDFDDSSIQTLGSGVCAENDEETSSTVTNCYYLEGTATEDASGAKAVTMEDVKSGKVARLLDPTGEVWGQDFDKGYPVPLGCLSDEEKAAAKIYTVTLSYGGTIETIYGNSDTPITPLVAPEGFVYTWEPELPATFGEVTGEAKYTGTLTEVEEPEDPDTPVIPDYPDYYNIMVEECEGVMVETSTNVVREGQSMTFTVDIAEGYTDENMTVKVKRSLFGYTEVIEPNDKGIYEVKNIYTDIYITVAGVEEEEEETPTGMEEMQTAKVYTKDGSIYVQTPKQEQVQIISISGAVLKNETQIGLQRYDLPRGIYIICIGEQRIKVRN